MDSANMDMLKVEAENRIRNLVWTVSEDYSADTEPDIDLFLKSKERGLYQACSQGAFFRQFDRQALSLYILKKLYYGADQMELARVVNIAMDAATCRALIHERPGIRKLREQAAEAFLDQELGRCASYPLGRLMLLWFGMAAGSEVRPDQQNREAMEKLKNLSREGTGTGQMIETIDFIYNRLVDPSFADKHGDLEKVLSVTLEELAEADFDWRDFLKEEALADLPETSRQESPEANGDKGKTSANKVIEIDPETRAKAYSYMELNFGRSYMNSLEQKRMNYKLCRGMHEGCSLFFTDGILENCVRRNYQSEYVRRERQNNLAIYKRTKTQVDRNVAILTETLRQALIRRSDSDQIKSETGQIRPRELWKIGRTGERRLFEKTVRKDGSDFVVDILVDASGSQRDRRGAVAVQAFIISDALSQAGIPHRVQSFCTCWDYTIMQRFREYDDPREENMKIFNYSTSANNRDGLAIRAAVHTLQTREEENKILIILSDGRPNDRIVNRTFTRAPVEYTGETAVWDTAEEVRKARHAGIAVLGVFAGKEEDLSAEKKIFGRDFAYIRDIKNFSPVVGRYLRRQLDQM